MPATPRTSASGLAKAHHTSVRSGGLWYCQTRPVSHFHKLQFIFYLTHRFRRRVLIKKIISILLLTTALYGCAYVAFRDTNRANLNNIQIGMKKSDVFRIMGTGTASGVDGTISNPYKTELIRAKDGNTYEILYYYTEHVGKRNWQSGMTPIILGNGHVIGVGWGYLSATSNTGPNGPDSMVHQPSNTLTSVPRTTDNSAPTIEQNAYGAGLHMDQYGRPTRLSPDFGAVNGEILKIKPNAYGPGIHMDQYGRPVREYPQR